jgi:hypothetical protein
MPLSLATPPSRVHVAALAGAFTDVLQDWLSPPELEAMRVANRRFRGTSTCASHDYCDANMAMLDAFQSTFGAEPRIADQPDGGQGPDIALWNAAWSLASKVWLTAPGRTATPAFHHTLLVKLSDHHGDSVSSLSELLEDLSPTTSATRLAAIENDVLTSGVCQGGGGAEPVWTITLIQPTDDID